MPTMLIELPAVAMRSAFIPPNAGPRSKDRDASPVEGHPPSPHDTSYRCTHGDTLTAREREVLRMIGRGFCNKRIARALKISPETVKSHVKHILLKMAVNMRAAEEEHERLRELESHLAHMNRVSVMGELAGSLAHEITQPIATARNNARAAMGFLDRSPPDLSEVREALECIVADADRAGDIIDRIRDQIKKAPPRKGRFDLNQAISEVIVLARSAITKNGVSVQTHLTEGLAPVQGDRVQLQQVVLNLILNAVEAMSSVEVEARELLITTEQNQTGDVLVAVRDSGPGIDPKHVERVFEAFYTTKSSGLGMGLSICRSIIDAHGGRLWADVNEPRGAAFQFTLPSAEEELMNFLQAAHQTGEPCEDTASDASHQVAYEGNKRLHRSRREPGQRHWGRQ